MNTSLRSVEAMRRNRRLIIVMTLTNNLITPFLHYLQILLHTFQRRFALVALLFNDEMSGPADFLGKIDNLFHLPDSSSKNRAFKFFTASCLNFIFYMEGLEPAGILF